MKFKELIAIADKGFYAGGDGGDADALNELVKPDDSLRKGSSCGDTLALFIVRELHDTYDEELEAGDQLQEAIRAMEMARRDIDNVIGAFEELYNQMARPA